MIDPVSQPISISALQGMQNSQTQLEHAASKIAHFPAAVGSSQPGDTVDLSAEMIAMLEARDNFMANVAAFKTGDEMQRSLLNLVA